MHILIIEDDLRLSQALSHILKDNGYDVDAVYDGADGLSWAESDIYDVIILDGMLPKKDGFEVACELRRQGIATPILMLTARDTISDKVTGLDSGADTYMTKPFAPAELLANLRALTRRRGEVVFEKITVGDLVLHLQSEDLTCNTKEIHLSHKEFELAQVLMTNAGNVLTKDALLTKVWGVDSNAEDNNVEAYVSFLRKKIRFLGSEAKIEALRKVGYRLISSDDTSSDSSKEEAS